jgi:hypothetical protein
MMQTAITTIPPSSKASAGMTDQSVAEKHEPAQTAVSLGDAEKREAMIRIAAYTFYERRGYVSGHELEDWLQAEMEIDRQSTAAPKPTEVE